MADEDIDSLKKRLDKCENEIVILTKTLKDYGDLFSQFQTLQRLRNYNRIEEHDQLDKRLKHIEELCIPQTGKMNMAEAYDVLVAQLSAMRQCVIELQGFEKQRRGEDPQELFDKYNSQPFPERKTH